VVEDVIVVSTGSLGLRSASSVELTVQSPFVKVLDSNGQPAVIRKSTLCWLLRSGDTRLSSDRLQRVQAERVTQRPLAAAVPGCQPHQVASPKREDFVTVGDWCAFKSEDDSIAVGRILAFSYLSGPTRSSHAYSALSAPTEPPSQNARGLGCLCSWFQLCRGNELKATDMDVHGFYDMRHYICHLPRTVIASTALILPCSASSIQCVR